MKFITNFTPNLTMERVYGKEALKINKEWGIPTKITKDGVTFVYITKEEREFYRNKNNL